MCLRLEARLKRLKTARGGLLSLTDNRQQTTSSLLSCQHHATPTAQKRVSTMHIPNTNTGHFDTTASALKKRKRDVVGGPWTQEDNNLQG